MVRGFKKLILLSQFGGKEAPYINVTPQIVDFNSMGGTTTMAIESNIEWNISIN
jgi:hypothetical protein